MPFTNEQIENLEKKYFVELGNLLMENRDELKKGFNSRLAIRRDTEGISYNENEVAVGSERVLSSIILRNKNDWEVNSSPISSNLLFELPDAMMNIDAKTYKENAIEEDKVNVARNQTSYGSNEHLVSQGTGTRYTWKAALKPIYHHETKGEIPTISMIVKFVYDIEDQKLKKVQLINIPNGKLIGVYGNRDIFNRGKSGISPGKPVRDIRFKISVFENPMITSGWNRRKLVLETD